MQASRTAESERIMNGMPWVKLYTKKIHDSRLKMVSEKAKLGYFYLMCLAGECDASGSFTINGIQLTEKQIAEFLGLDLDVIKTSMRELTKVGLMSVNGHGPFLTDFADEQVSQAQRQEQWRARQQRKRDSERDVTSDNQRDSERDVTAPESESRVRIQSQKARVRSRPTTLPSSAQTGRQAGPNESPRAPIKLNKAQRARKETIKKILGSFRLRNPKLETLSNILAIRSYKSDEQMITSLLAGFASALSDATAGNKEAVAAYRLEHDEVPPRFEDPKEWKVIPEKVLKAAGIDLERYAAKDPSTPKPNGVLVAQHWLEGKKGARH